MRITVTTGDGDKPSPEITDDLLSSTESFIARGTSLLFGSVDAYQHTILQPLQSMINTGEIGEIHDYKYGESYRAKVNGISITIDKATIDKAGIDIKLDMERPA